VRADPRPASSRDASISQPSARDSDSAQSLDRDSDFLDRGSAQSLDGDFDHSPDRGSAQSSDGDFDHSPDRGSAQSSDGDFDHSPDRDFTQPLDRDFDSLDRDFVQSLDRGLAVIRTFGSDRARLRLSDVARATGLTTSVARRFLLTLTRLGYIRSDGAEFSLRPRVLELGYGYMSGLALPEVAAPHVQELVARLHESSSISVLDGPDIVYLVRVPAKRIMTVAISVGTRLPAYATSMGRVLLAALTQDELDSYLAETTLERLTGRTVTEPSRLRAEIATVARQGYAIVDQELEEGLRAIAAPIRAGARVGTAAINVSADASLVSMAALRSELLPALLDVAAQIEADLMAQGQSQRSRS
jgi:IclR family transcriptional regulator, pca regulon regulatory protein